MKSNQKLLYKARTQGIIKFMLGIYLLTFSVGTITFYLREELTQQNFRFFTKTSLLYLIFCFLLYLAIKSQRLILKEDHLILTIFGWTRYKISVYDIEKCEFGKLNGEIVIHITLNKKIKCAFPYYPFQKAWEEISDLLKEKNKSIQIYF
ncbi:EbsA family protein [Metabacillus litoralis]|uniref:EbsA family protein n=1 Tax=Metabacillus litoralis TaxID=152268 RepID=UPI001CFD5E24|nr:EbsA family protein [Metabacillus litoralis]